MRRREFLGRSVGVLAVGGLVAVPALAARTNRRFMSELLEPIWIEGKRIAAGVRDPWEPGGGTEATIRALGVTGPLEHRGEIFWSGPGWIRWHTDKGGRRDFPSSFGTPIPDGIAVPELRRGETMADVLARFEAVRDRGRFPSADIERTTTALAITGPVAFCGCVYRSPAPSQITKTLGVIPGVPLAALVPVPVEFLAPGEPGNYAVVRANSRALAHISG